MLPVPCTAQDSGCLSIDISACVCPGFPGGLAAVVPAAEAVDRSVRFPAGACHVSCAIRPCRFSRLRRFHPHVASRACCIPLPILGFAQLISCARAPFGAFPLHAAILGAERDRLVTSSALRWRLPHRPVRSWFSRTVPIVHGQACPPAVASTDPTLRFVPPEMGGYGASSSWKLDLRALLHMQVRRIITVLPPR